MNSASGLRLALFKREGGVCVRCKVDCEALVRRIRVLKSRSKRKSEIVKLHPAFGQRGAAALLNRLARTARAGHAWECDHIVGVYEGGGMCTVENAQTLCVVCHAEKTKAQAKDRAKKRRALASAAASTAPAAKRHACDALPQSDSDSEDIRMLDDDDATAADDDDVVVIDSGVGPAAGPTAPTAPTRARRLSLDSVGSHSSDIDDDDLLAPVFT